MTYNKENGIDEDSVFLEIQRFNTVEETYTIISVYDKNGYIAGSAGVNFEAALNVLHSMFNEIEPVITHPFADQDEDDDAGEE